jgi:hypothetical protein
VKLRPMQYFAFVVCLLSSSALMAQSPNATNAAGAKFGQLSQNFIHETLVLSPSSASPAGYQRHFDRKTGKEIELDGLSDDVSEAGMAEQQRLYEGWQKRFHSEVPLSSLDPEDAADWRLVDDPIVLNLLEQQRIPSIHRYQRPRLTQRCVSTTTGC